MPTLRFLGRLVPIDVVTSLGTTSHGEFANKEGLEGKWRLNIIDSNVTMIVDVNRFDTKSHIRAIGNFVDDTTELAAHLLSLKTGIGFRGVIERFIDPVANKIEWIHVQDFNLPKHITTLAAKDSVDQFVKLAIEDMNLQMILRDITDGLRHSYTGPIGAARAMDGICNYFKPKNGERKHGWPLMHAALNVSADYVRSITKQSEAPRHADWIANSALGASDGAIERGWVCVNRFLEYRKRGDQPLSAPDFPLLDFSQA